MKACVFAAMFFFYSFYFISCKTSAPVYSEVKQSEIAVQRIDFVNTWPYKKIVIFIDDEKYYFKMLNGELLSIPVNYGSHSIYTKIGSSKSETIYFIANPFSDFQHFITVINGKLFNKKKIILYKKVLTDKTWWSKMAYQFPIKHGAPQSMVAV